LVALFFISTAVPKVRIFVTGLSNDFE